MIPEKIYVCANPDCTKKAPGGFRVITSRTKRCQRCQSLSLYVYSQDVQHAQRQDSLQDQLDTVLELAVKYGCYDAHDFLKRTLA